MPTLRPHHRYLCAGDPAAVYSALSMTRSTRNSAQRRATRQVWLASLRSEAARLAYLGAAAAVQTVLWLGWALMRWVA